ncbi:hypothetical protein FKW77_006804 [Venturia effusa]|uniref:Major facilitator superfamily (MFS) profile domain-containing protein n=1 Tax=Venturia effusa TaxID=50376 RepID=A0A517LCH9_9PEZI|nr:hypothetical protein FKW77_006804 [Venturia effusa]
MADVQPIAEKGPANETSADEPEENHDSSSPGDLTYDNEDEEPELHARTYIALAAMFLLNFIQAFALTGPPTVLSYIGTDLHDPLSQTWIPSVFSLVQAVLSPLFASISDTFQARKALLVVPALISFIGAAIAPTATSMSRWIMMAVWGLTAAGIFFGYRPPRRHTRFDSLSFLQKIRRLDLPGFGLLTAGLTLLLTGINLGGGLYSWNSGPVLSTLIIGIVLLVSFGLYEWRITETGILDHALFRGGKHRGRTFAICVALMFLEGIIVFGFFVFYPVLTASLFEEDPFLGAARIQPYWLACGLGTIIFGIWSTRARTIKVPLLVGFAILTSGFVGLATIQPGHSLSAVVFAGLAGLGVGAPLILILAGVQLSTPHHLIATATAATTSARSVSGTAFTAIYAAALNDGLTKKMPAYIANAVIRAGLPLSSVAAFVNALAAKDTAALPKIPGVTPMIIQAGLGGMKQAFADSIRVVYIIAAPFGLLACIGCLFLGDLRTTMSYRVDAPVEKLKAKHHRGNTPIAV